MLINLVIGIVCASYVVLLFILIIGWFSTDKADIASQIPKTTFSIVVPFRNEVKNIYSCINSLLQLNYPESLFEVILVNDHSNDNTEAIIDNLIKDKTNFHLHSLKSKSGKKQALTHGIKTAISQYIVTTDADCTHHTSWLTVLNNKIQSTNAAMVVAPVQFTQTSIFSRLLALDFLSLTGTMTSFHSLNHPILSNGANLTFEKKKFYQVKGYESEIPIASGDDILLLQKFRELTPTKIELLLNKAATVKTIAPESIKAYLSQRIRWASKISSHQNFLSKLVGLIVLFTNTTLLLLFCSALLKHDFVEIFLLLFIAKCIIDFLFLFLISSFFGVKRLLWWIILTELFNMIMIPTVSVGSLFFKYNWKGRKH